MYSVEELFGRLDGKAIKDYGIFKDWLKGMGSRVSETAQLQWILESPKIADSTKQRLTEAIVREASAVDKEMDILLRVGYTTEKHEESIRKTQESIEELHSKIRTACFAMATALMLVFFIVNASYNADPRDFGSLLLLLMFFFGCAVVCLVEAWESSSYIKDSQKKAMKTEDEYVGHRLQMRIAAVEKDEEKLHELNKLIVKYGVENAKNNANTSLA